MTLEPKRRKRDLDDTGSHGRHWSKQVPSIVWVVFVGMLGYTGKATLNQIFNDQMDVQVATRHLVTEQAMTDALEINAEEIVYDIDRKLDENDVIMKNRFDDLKKVISILSSSDNRAKAARAHSGG